MAKSLSAQLLADIQANVTRLATCVQLKRKDGRFIRLTSHDADLVIDSETYRHDIPFGLGDISTDSQLTVDNTEIVMFADETVIKLTDMQGGLYDYAEVMIFLVDYQNLGHGSMKVRRGWLGEVRTLQNGVCTSIITGLTKVLDFEVGRVYQPSCDADLGDKRCKVAIDQNQLYSPYNRYNLGDWVYHYDPALYTAFTVVNSSFEVDGTRTIAQAITGWTRTPNSYLAVKTSGETAGVFGPLDGTYMLVGTDDLGAGAIGLENGVYQDIDLIAATTGLTTADIDGGKISAGYIVGLMQGFYLLDPYRLAIEIRDANGELIDGRDTGYIHGKTPKDQFDKWKEHALVFPLKPGSRTARLYIWFRKDDGQIFNHAADKVRFFWWNHTTGSAYDSVVHRLTRVVAFGEDALANVTNPSFEADGLVSNADNPTISGWTTGAGNWWQVTNSGNGGGLANQHGAFYLKGGDDGGAVQRTYSISQTRLLTTDFGLDAARILLGKYTGRFFAYVGWTDTASAATITLEFLDNANSVVGTVVVLNAQTNAGAPVWGSGDKNFVVPVSATKVRTTLQAITPVGDGTSGTAFDSVEYFFYDAERASRSDPIFGRGNVATVFSTTPGAYTIDIGEAGFIWKAVSAFVGYDLVATAISDKVFRGTDIAGIDGTYETAAMLWLSGNNAGLKNLIRRWGSVDKEIKLYFKPLHPVQVGDRFMYVRSCQKRFLEDCQLIFSNAVNFRGFPHLPGRIK